MSAVDRTECNDRCYGEPCVHVSTPVDEVPDVSTLSAAHRCERCGAQAYVRVRLPSGATLDFCAHDYRASEPGLAKAGAAVLVDDRHRLEPAG